MSSLAEASTVETPAADLTPACPVCGAGGVYFAPKDGYEMYRCTGCTLVFVYPLPTREALLEAYAGDWYIVNQWCETADAEYQPRHRFLRVQRWQWKARKLRGMCGGDSLLEIGCGQGDYLRAAAAAGFTRIVAMEPSIKEARYARSLGFDVRDGVFEEIDFGDSRFDAIVARHVIEHVTDPVAVLRKAIGLLRPHGRIWLETPCTTHRKALRAGPHWKCFCPPWHLHVFNERSLTELFTRCELVPVHVRRHLRRADMTGVARLPEG